jgi:hypothetical protein
MTQKFKDILKKWLVLSLLIYVKMETSNVRFRDHHLAQELQHEEQDAVRLSQVADRGA